MSGLITPVVRAALGRVPLHCFSAPEAGTGKSYLVDLLRGRRHRLPRPGHLARQGRDGIWRSGSAPCSLPGIRSSSIDNVSRPLQGDFICQMIERGALKVRLLGYSKDVHIEPPVVSLCTGNNLTLVGDIVRRVAGLPPRRGERNALAPPVQRGAAAAHRRRSRHLYPRRPDHLPGVPRLRRIPRSGRRSAASKAGRTWCARRWSGSAAAIPPAPSRKPGGGLPSGRLSRRCSRPGGRRSAARKPRSPSW